MHEGVELDRCPNGHGLWLDRGELREVANRELEPRSEAEEDAARAAAIRDSGHAVVAEAGAARRPCPVCAQPMRLTEYAASGIPIDECHAHGVWLDAGELEQIEAYAESVRRDLHQGSLTKASSSVAGIDVPEDLLATITSIGAPPPA